MKLDKLRIDGFKNLKNVEVDFDEDSSYTVLIGQNGAGKSNVLEALALIFRSLEFREDIPFRYLLRYKCKRNWVQIDKDWSSSEHFVEIWAASDDPDASAGARISMAHFHRRVSDFMPDHIFGYYSGESHRLERIFNKSQNKYYRDIIKAGVEKNIKPGDPGLRRMFYSHTSYGQLTMLAFLAFHDEMLSAFLRKHMGIEEMHSALVVLKQPYWAKKSPSVMQIQNGDPNVWYATGLVRHLLEPLWEHAIAPIRTVETVQTDYRGQEQTEERLYLFIKDQPTLLRLAAGLGDQKSFFTLLEALEISDLVSEVRIWVRRRGLASELPFHEISDGERQLLTVIGLMRFTGLDESLFLLDEPDTHLNPGWKWKYLDLVDEIAASGVNCHLLLTSHDPLTIAGLEAKQVRIMSRDTNGNVQVSGPPVDPRGLGVSGVLTDIFGMHSTLDKPTQKLIDQRNTLVRLDDLSTDQLSKLDELNSHLRRLGFRYGDGDELYRQYLKARDDVEFGDELPLSPEEIERRDEITRELIQELLRQK